MSEEPIIDPKPIPEPEQKPPFGSWSRMYIFVVSFMALLIVLFLLFSNTFTR